MPRITHNYLVKGARGNMAKQFVYKKRGNDTHIARMPEIDKNAEPTVEQEKIRDSFSLAALYAKGAISDPDLKKEYQKKANEKQTAYNVAFRDFLKPPKVTGINVESYNGTPGSTIVVSAKDDFRVKAVEVSIRTAGGVLVEKGNATLNPVDRSKWIYTCTQSNATLAGSIINAAAFDLPGNKATLEITL